MVDSLAVVIVTFGREDLTRGTIDSLLMSKIDRSLVSIHVVDNGSQPELVQYLTSKRDQFDSLTLLGTNMGKPYAWNLGASIAREHCKVRGHQAPQFLLFCDNDLLFENDWYQPLITTYKEHAAIPIAGLCAMRWHGHQVADVRNGPTRAVYVTRFPAGCCILMSTTVYDHVGHFDTGRLIRTVDTCWYQKAQAKGYVNAGVYPHSFIVHTGNKRRCWDLATGTPRLE